VTTPARPSSMWTSREERLTAPRGLRCSIERDATPASFADVLVAWQDDASFRALFNDLLAAVSFEVFRWETPPVTAATLTRAFEFVLLDCPELARRPEPQAFAEHFERAPDSSVVTFANLGGDAILIAPRLEAAPSAYGHLAAFVREAPEAQRHALWTSVGVAMTRRVGPRPVWLSTAGDGVSWLHVRLDDRPKYYWFDAYRRGA